MPNSGHSREVGVPHAINVIPGESQTCFAADAFSQFLSHLASVERVLKEQGRQAWQKAGSKLAKAVRSTLSRPDPRRPSLTMQLVHGISTTDFACLRVRSSSLPLDVVSIHGRWSLREHVRRALQMV